MTRYIAVALIAGGLGSLLTYVAMRKQLADAWAANRRVLDGAFDMIIPDLDAVLGEAKGLYYSEGSEAL